MNLVHGNRLGMGGFMSTLELHITSSPAFIQSSSGPYFAICLCATFDILVSSGRPLPWPLLFLHLLPSKGQNGHYYFMVALDIQVGSTCVDKHFTGWTRVTCA